MKSPPGPGPGCCCCCCWPGCCCCCCCSAADAEADGGRWPPAAAAGTCCCCCWLAKGWDPAARACLHRHKRGHPKTSDPLRYMTMVPIPISTCCPRWQEKEPSSSALPGGYPPSLLVTGVPAGYSGPMPWGHHHHHHPAKPASHPDPALPAPAASPHAASQGCRSGQKRHRRISPHPHPCRRQGLPEPPPHSTDSLPPP